MKPTVPHPPGCRAGIPSRTLPARPCATVTLQSLAARLARVEDLVNNVARLHRKEICQRYGWSDRNFYRKQRAGVLPAPICHDVGRLWRLSDLEAMEQSGRLPRPKSA